MLRLKSTLVPPPGVFLGRVYKSLELYWTKQHADYEARLESAKTQTPIRADFYLPEKSTLML